MKTNKQPINDVKWLHRNELSANLYNPNHVAPPEIKLLKESILNDGWLFPILVLDKKIKLDGLTSTEDKYTIIDGFHRYTISKDKKIYNLTDGYLPVLILNPKNIISTTVRMNRAKGTHSVIKMSDIIEHEIKAGKSLKYIMNNYGMEKEEVIRLSYSKGIHKSNIIEEDDFSQAWEPE